MSTMNQIYSHEISKHVDGDIPFMGISTFCVYFVGADILILAAAYY